MTVSRQPQINEELLSAYLDNEVTDEERALVEAAIATDPAVAWQVESLRQTVQLLQVLPPLALPRAFTLETLLAESRSADVVTAAQGKIAQAGTEQRAVAVLQQTAPKQTTTRQQTASDQPNNWWHWLLQIWQGGNLQFRNAAAVAFTLLLVLFMSDRFIAPYQSAPPPIVSSQSAKIAVTTGSEEATAAPADTETTAMGALTTAAPAQPTVDSSQGATIADQATNNAADSPTKTTSEKVAPVSTLATSTQATQRAALLRAPDAPGEDIVDLRGNDAGGTSNPMAQSASASALADDSRQMMVTGIATGSSAPTGITQTTGASTQEFAAPSAMTLTPAPASALAITVTATLTPTSVPTSEPTTAITTTAAVSVAGQLTPIEITDAPRQSPGLSTTDQGPFAENTQPWLTWAEVVAGVFTVVLSGLWWRSRGVNA